MKNTSNGQPCQYCETDTIIDSDVIVAPRHVARWSELSTTEQISVFAALSSALDQGITRFEPVSVDGHFAIRLGARPQSHSEPIITGGEDPLLQHLIAHIDSSDKVDLAVAFALESGVAMLEPYLKDLLARGGAVRLIVGDYFDVTEPAALRRIADLNGNIDARVFETVGGSFHPKAWLFRVTDQSGVAIVGSSNLTRTAMTTGVEWNLRTEDATNWKAVLAAFETLHNAPEVKPLTADWIDAYARRRKKQQLPVMAQHLVEEDTPLAAPSPHNVQADALKALASTRAAGRKAGLVVLATGLGKTWLSAFDSQQFDRILFVAHREEILAQAMATYRKFRPEGRFAYYTGTAKEHGDIVFASIQTIGRPAHLRRFDPDEFDYIVVDEFHHAAAKSYLALLEHFTPKFMLGLTATPDRTDGADLLALCDDNLVYRCDLYDGITRGLLSPFEYFGVADDVDYAQIPWRSSQFDPEALTTALATRARAQNALEQLREKGRGPAIGFCVSRRHAEFMAEYFTTAGMRAVAVHSGEGSAPRTSSLESLGRGELDILFAVDMFNEGVDVPEIGTVLMLRPTESAILFLQQLGRGLRLIEGKVLRVIDYIGNHRVFLTKVRALLSAGTGDRSVSRRLDDVIVGKVDLPPGCEITYDLKAIDFLKALIPQRAGQEEGEAWYRAFIIRHRQRPQAYEFANAGFDPSKTGHGGWFNFVRDLGDIVPQVAEQNALLLKLIEKTRFTAPQEAAFISLAARRGGLQDSAASAQINAYLARAGITGIGDFADRARQFWAMSPHVRLSNGRWSLVRDADNPAIGPLVDELVRWRLLSIANDTSNTEINDPPVIFVTAPVLWQEYMREEIPPLFGTTFNPGNWNSGIVSVDKGLVLLTTLKKGALASGNHYDDLFLTPDMMQWQSQTQTTQASARGQILSGQVDGKSVHLFVRSEKLRGDKAAPFLYLGQPLFVKWSGEKPITITWKLPEPVPEHFHRMLSVPDYD